MEGTPFKTPQTTHRQFQFHDNGATSDSEESVASSTSDNGEISLVAEFDDLMRAHESLYRSKMETEAAFLDFVDQAKLLNLQLFEAKDECQRLKDLLEKRVCEVSDLENKLRKARKLLDLEKANTRNARKERNEYESQIQCVREVLFKDKNVSNRISHDMFDKLSFLNNQRDDDDYRQAQLSAIKEINSTGSILSDFSYSRSDDDLDIQSNFMRIKKHRPSTDGIAEPAIKKRKSAEKKIVEIGASDTVRATTTLTVCKDGPVTATSIIESVPKTPGKPDENVTNVDQYHAGPPSNLILESWARESPRKPERYFSGRQHSFMQKTMVMPDNCVVCEKRIRFGKTAVKCKECRGVCHVECKEKLPLPCIPLLNTPNGRNGLGVISDYTSSVPPMVPAILIHCINEIEMRGLSEVGLYRVPGSERDVRSLKERFLKGRGAPCLNEIDVHVICGTVKDFLRTLNEPIVTYARWKRFVEATESNDSTQALCNIISDLPQPNRDTLAYMILHLQRISRSPDCKMTVSNLAKVFGPTIVGYSSDNPNAATLLEEMVKHNCVMENLINIPGEFWVKFIDIDHSVKPLRLQSTPSTDSLMHSTTSRGFMTPNRTMLKLKRKQKFFPSPQH